MLSLFQKKTSKGVKKEIHKCDTLPSKNRSSMLSEKQNHSG